MKKIFLTLIATILLITAVSATDVAYIVTNELAVNNDLTVLINEAGFDYEIIYSFNLPEDFSDYKMILLNNEEFPNPNEIPVNDYPVLIINGEHMRYWGWVEQISESRDDSPSHINLSNLDHTITNLMEQDVQVYTSDNPTLYSLRSENRYRGIKPIAYRLDNAEDAVIAIVEAGTILTKAGEEPTQVNANSVFFGIHETQYWTPQAKQLFKNSLIWLAGEIEQPPTYDIELSEGYNLVSFPLILEDNTVQNILDSNSEIESIKKYDGTNIVDTTQVTNDKGYFIQTTSATTLTIEGTEPTGQQNVILNSGMNLVGISSLSNVNFNTLPDEVIEVFRRNPDGTFDIATKYNDNWYNSFDLEPGKGYWFKLNSGGTWSYSP